MKKVKLMVHPEVKDYLDRVIADTKAHHSASEYWKGAAAGALIAGNTNPRRIRHSYHQRPISLTQMGISKDLIYVCHKCGREEYRSFNKCPSCGGTLIPPRSNPVPAIVSGLGQGAGMAIASKIFKNPLFGRKTPRPICENAVYYGPGLKGVHQCKKNKATKFVVIYYPTLNDQDRLLLCDECTADITAAARENKLGLSVRDIQPSDMSEPHYPSPDELYTEKDLGEPNPVSPFPWVPQAKNPKKYRKNVTELLIPGIIGGIAWGAGSGIWKSIAKKSFGKKTTLAQNPVRIVQANPSRFVRTACRKCGALILAYPGEKYPVCIPCARKKARR